jgi:hypothetical protein
MSETIDPNRWYSVKETGWFIGWLEDATRRLIRDGFISAQIKPNTSPVRHRKYEGMRVKGSEIIRYLRDNSTTLRTDRKRRHAA